jgi:hypothetical protein
MILSPAHHALLRTSGMSTKWLAEQTGHSVSECKRALEAVGAKRCNSRWMLPSLARTEARDRILSGNHVGTHRDECGRRK